MPTAMIQRDVEPPGLRAITVAEAFRLTCAALPDAVALRTTDGIEISFAEWLERAGSIAAALHEIGVRRGDTLALMMLNRPEFNVCDAAGMMLGATCFSMYPTSSPEQIAQAFDNAGNRVVITEPAFVDMLRAADPPALEHIICIDDAPAGTTPLAEFEARGDPRFDVAAGSAAVAPDDVLTLIYTSGTTGPPKGVETTHANVMAEAQALWTVIPHVPGDRILSFLPHAHIADRLTSHYATMIYGVTCTIVSDPRQVAAALPEVRPTIWGGPPRIWEKIKAGLEAKGITDPAGVPDAARQQVREALGLGDCEMLFGGAAPSSVEVLDYFRDLGMPISELWGMSETTCVATINPLDDIRHGTVGKPLPGVEVRLADDGELLCRGPIVMRGYRGDPEQTREALDDDDWLHTGDIAKIDADGYVTIVDRKKEIIVNASGKNMSPATIEARIKGASMLIGQVACIGDKRPYNVALIVLDPDGAAQWASAHGRADASPVALAGDDELRSEIAAAVEAGNARLSRVEQIKRWALLPTEWPPGREELTPTMKLKRRPISEKYAEEIEALYA